MANSTAEEKQIAASAVTDAQLPSPVPSPQLPKACDSCDDTPNKAGKSFNFQWAQAAAMSGLTLAIILIDVSLNDTSGSWFSLETITQFPSSVLSSKMIVLDCSAGAVLFALCVWKFGFCSSARRKGKATEKKKQPGSTGKQALRKASPKKANRQEEDGCNGDSKASPHGRKSPDLSTSRLNQSIDLAARQGDIDKAGRLLLEFEDKGDANADSVSYNLVIRAHARKGDAKGAKQWLARMEKNGLQPTLCSYNTVLDSFAKADDAEACELWLKSMLAKGVEANEISYATVIYARARRGEETLAAAWLHKMIGAGIVPDAVCYNSMIHACGVTGNAAGAEHWIEELQKQGLDASVTTFTAVIDACAKAGDVPRAEKWLEAMIQAKVEPNVVSFSAMICACAKSSDPVRAEYWHDRMVECKVEPNAHSYGAIMNAFAKVGDVTKAEEWLGKAEQDGIANDVVLYSSVIDACGKAGDAERAVAIFERMKSHGIRPHIIAYASLARPFAYRGDWKAVEDIAADMEINRVAPNEYFVYAQLLAYATARPRQADRAENCFRKALKLRIKANDHIVTALARAVGRDRCSVLMAELCKGRPVPLRR